MHHLPKRPRLIVAVMAMLMVEQTQAVEFSTAEVGGKRVTVCRVNVRQERLRLFHRNEAGQPFKRFKILSSWLQTRDRKLVFAMNAGMFHPDFSAVGLLVEDGKQQAPLNTDEGKGNFFLKPNGVFVLTDTGARVIESSAYPQLRETVVLATQSGPLLVGGGRLHPAFNAGSTSRLIRNGVGVVSPEVVVFAISDEPVNFHEFATFFRDTLQCQDALYLDGVISSLHAPALKRSDDERDLGPIFAVTE